MSGMTRKEAIKVIENNRPTHGYTMLCEALDVAIADMEKQIPKKIKYKNRHGEGADLWNKDYFNCPSCGRRLRNKQKDNHCGRCGIDWGEEND